MSDKETARRTLLEKADRFYRVFSTHEGKKVLEDLREELNPDILIAPNAHATTYNVGRRDAFIYIDQLMRYSENAARDT